MSRDVSDVLTLFRRIVARNNPNDPNANFSTMIRYINDFYAFHMNKDVHLFQLEGTLEFTIDQNSTDGVYTFNDVGAGSDFEYLTVSGFINDNDLIIWHNPYEFYHRWQTFDVSELTPGMPTDMLFYGNELVFRTIPDQEYTVRIFGYKANVEFDEGNTAGDEALPFAEWVRYIAYGAARNYSMDFNYDEARINSIKAGFIREKNILMTKQHNVVKFERSIPRF